MSFFKAIPFGGLLAGLVSLFIGKGGGTAGLLNVQLLTLPVEGYTLWWSWPLFGIGTLLAWFIIAMQQ